MLKSDLARGSLQVYAGTQKNFIEKRRSAASTFCELTSHCFIFVLLLFGYQLSFIVNFEKTFYDTLSLEIPPFNVSGGQVWMNITRDHSNTTAILRNETDIYGSTYNRTDLELVQKNSYTGLFNTISNLLISPTPMINLQTFLSIQAFLASELSLGGASADLLSQTSQGQSYSNLIAVKRFYFVGNPIIVADLIRYLNTSSPIFRTLRVYNYTTEAAALKVLMNTSRRRTVFALIVLREISNKTFSYDIRMDYTTLPNTNLIIDYSMPGLNTLYQRYTLSGFLSLQSSIDDWAWKRTESARLSNRIGRENKCDNVPRPWSFPMPTPAYSSNDFYAQVGFLLGLAMTMASLYPMSRLTKAIVEEKESHLREIMKIMGLFDWAAGLSWYLISFIIFTWIAATSTFLAKISFFPNTNVGLLFIYFWLFALSEISVCFFISVFFSNAKLASIFAPVFLFITLLPRFAFINTNENEVVEAKYLACLLPGTAFSFGADIIAQYEYIGAGLQADNIFNGMFNFVGVLQFLFIDIFIYGFLAWYLDKVYPQEYGTPKHPLFIFSAAYWFESTATDVTKTYAPCENIPELGYVKEGSNPNPNIEVMSSALRAFAKVRICGLSKRFDDSKIAVSKLDMAMVEGEITCLLGHNGAGKTTTISILTGMLEPSEGNVNIYDKSLNHDLARIRQEIGICPQQNVLFNKLTVYEHLRFFGNIKGMHGEPLEKRIDEVVTEIGLHEKLSALSTALSGGMKRKLSLAIALIGNPKFVLLDEPTSGMDPYSRRSTWSFLQKCKANRVILLTTHFMDEADILGDRIVIMSDGRVRCSGSSLYLKSRFGAGYVLSLSKTTPNAPVDIIEDGVRSVVPEAVISSAVAGEVSFSLPLTCTSKFPELFHFIETNANPLSISSFGIAITSLEQVFISLAKQSHLEPLPDDYGVPPTLYERFIFCLMVIPVAIYNRFIRKVFPALPAYGLELSHHCAFDLGCGHYDDSKPQVTQNIPKTDYYSKCQCLPAFELAKIQLYELLNKRYIIASRDVKGFFFSVIFPAFQILAVLGILTISFNPAGVSLPMNASIFNPPAGVVLSNNLVNQSSSATSNQLSRSRMNIIPGQFYGNSYNLSRYLGRVYDDKHPLQNIAYVFNDRVNASVDVDWQFIRETLINTANGDKTYDKGFSLAGFDIRRGVPLEGLTLTSDLKTLFSDDDSANAILGNFGLNVNSTISIGSGLNQPGLILFINNLNSSGIANLTSNQLQNALGNLTLVTFQGNNLNSIRLVEDNQNLIPGVITFINNTIINGNQVSGAVVQNGVIQINARTLINTYLETLPSTTASVTANSISAPGDGNLQLNQATVTLANTQKIKFNVIKVPAYILINALIPTGKDKYQFATPSAYTIIHNSSSPHGVSAFRGELLQTLFGECFNNPKFSYDVRNHPLPLTSRQTVQIKVIIALLTSIFILIPLCYIPSSFIVFVVKERTAKVTHLQYVSSVSPYIYWISNFLWDMAMFTILSIMTMCFFFIYGTDSSAVFVSTSESTATVFFLFIFYGASIIPLSYLYSFAFESFSSAQISIMIINFFTGFIFILTYFILQTLKNTRSIASGLVVFFRFFPGYNIGEGLINLSTTYLRKFYLNQDVSYSDWDVAGRPLCFMALECIGYLGLVLLSETSFCRNFVNRIQNYRSKSAGDPRPRKGEIDADVNDEEVRIKSSKPEDYSLYLNNLIKTYPPSLRGGNPKFAVRGLSLGCQIGERFGLLGINGAGKSTTLGMLTGDLQPTDGSAYIAGLPLSDPKTRNLLGYCPQVDPLLDLMTGRETLWFFGRIRGIDANTLHARVQSLIEELGLSPHAKKPCGKYSGGNKRKLSLGVALIGDPKILLLDEPSTGMDPEARRHMWDVIARVSESRTVVLTTHSMEECEALCTRVGIMVSGRLQCLGASQHLKSKFSTGYQIEIRCYEGKAASALQFMLGSALSDLAVEEQHGNFVRLKGPANMDLEEAFRCLETNKGYLGIVDYSISQSTLEQVFIKFAKAQEEERGYLIDGDYIVEKQGSQKE